MKKLRIAICDDSESDAQETEERCRCACNACGILSKVRTFTSRSEFIFEMQCEAFLTRHDLIIIEPQGSFSTIGEIVRESGFDGQILYYSHSRSLDHFSQAFDVDATNYILKDPSQTCRYSKKRPTRPCNCRFREVCEQAIASIKKYERRYLALNCHGEYKQVELSSIFYFQGTSNHTVKLKFKNGECTFPGSLRELEEQLPEREFCRPHRSYIVALDAVLYVGSTTMTLHNGDKIPLSRTRIKAFRSLLERRGQTSEALLAQKPPH